MSIIILEETTSGKDSACKNHKVAITPLGKAHYLKATRQRFDGFVMVLPDLFRGMGAWRNSTDTQQSGHAPKSVPESKMEEVLPKMARRRGSDAGQFRKRWVRSSRGVRRHCKKNSSSVLSCIREGCGRGSEVGTVHSGWDGEVTL